MGQYHVIANLDKRMGFSPRSTGDFVKLMEFGQGSAAMCALVTLLDGAWHGERIAIVGDYAQSDDLDAENTLRAGISAEHLYAAINHPERLAAEHGVKPAWRNVGWLARKATTTAGLATYEKKSYDLVNPQQGTRTTHHFYESAMAPDTDTAPRVVVNLDQREKIDPAEFGDDRRAGVFAVTGGRGGTLTALAVLLAVSSTGGGRGGGDFRGESCPVGAWGGARIGLLHPDEATDYTDLSEMMRVGMSEAREGIYRRRDDGLIERGDRWEDNPWQHPIHAAF